MKLRNNTNFLFDYFFRMMSFKSFEDQLFDTLTDDDKSVRISRFVSVSIPYDRG